MKYFTKNQLVECAELGKGWGYNRQVDDTVAEVPDMNYMVEGILEHHHKQGVECEKHMRCAVVTQHRGKKEMLAFIDVPDWYFDQLGDDGVIC